MQHAVIKCLPVEVQGKLRSGVALPSLQQCVEELVVNSIDAGATCIGVRMDMDAFKIQVIDNGKGISAEDIQCVGKRYFTSKCNSLEDLEDLRFYGFRGEAVASMVTLATLVEISSRTKESMKTHVKMYKEGVGLDVFEAETSRPSSGTTITVCNYFYNMPVRRKRMDSVLENERIRQRVEAISLMHPSVSFTLKNDCTGAMVVQLPKARNTYYRFAQIHSLSRAQKLGEINYTSGQFEVTGYIGKEVHYNNSLQFLYVNKRLLQKTRIHKLLNALLRRLTSMNLKTDSPESHLNRSPKFKRSQDLYGVFIVDIKCPYTEYDVCLEPAKSLIEFKDWNDLVNCIEESVKDFLKRENLEVVFSLDDLESESPQKDIVDQYQDNTNAETVVSISNVPKIETVLSSESVYRSHAHDFDNQMDGKDNDREKQEENTLTQIEDSANNKDSKAPTEKCVVVDLDMRCNSGGEEATEEKIRNATQQTELFKSCKLQVQTSNSAECPTSVASHSSTDTRKVTLLDPFVHKSLDIGKHCKLTGQQISLENSQKRLWEESFHRPVPIKIRKLVSLSNISQSLDQFRRIHNKPPDASDVPESSTSKDLNHNSNCERNRHDAKTETIKNKCVCPPNPLNPTLMPLKPPTFVDKVKKSIASKLYQMKQGKKDPSISQLPVTETNQLSITDNLAQRNDFSCHLDIESAPNPTEEDKKTILDNWNPHYDSSIGKTVYVNNVTGLSSYEEPSTGSDQTRCTSDVTTMAVSVLSEAGDDDDSGRGNSLYSIYSKWNNPVFVKPPNVGVDISCGQADGLAVKVHNILFPYRFSKAMIPTMKVINQVDKKFLACLLNTREDLTVGESNAGNLLVLVDQHAAHERVRLENLIADAYEEGSGDKRLSSSIISPPLEVCLPVEDQRILRSCEAHLQDLGLEVTFSLMEDSRVFIGKVPMCFTEKDNNERRRGRPSVIKALVEEYLREQIELLRSAGRLGATLPLTVQRVLASFACHGAIKFNDSLSRDECFSLVASLSQCQLPFQCAHGRPSIAPLVDLNHTDKEDMELPRPNLLKLRRLYKAWK
ncbi:unnamed protein product [Knipowitschia caucasica]